MNITLKSYVAECATPSPSRSRATRPRPSVTRKSAPRRPDPRRELSVSDLRDARDFVWCQKHVGRAALPNLKWVTGTRFFLHLYLMVFGAC